MIIRLIIIQNSIHLLVESQYTHLMRIIDRQWTELAAGYQAVQALKARLDAEFDRAIEVGYQQQYRRDVIAWQKKRRVFFSFVVIAPLSVLALCLSAYYFREVACVIVYWIVVVGVILVTLGVAARSYIVDAVQRPKMGPSGPVPLGLEGRWWAGLAPQELALRPAPGKPSSDFLAFLDDLPDTFLARRGPLVEGEACVYVFAPSGPWIFTLRDWSGDIIRQENLWKRVHKGGEAVMYAQAPDAQWVRQKETLANILNERFPQLGGRIHGGVVFIDPKVRLQKDLIEGNTAAYGLAIAWTGRLRQAPAVEGLTTEMQFETLDALIAQEKYPGEQLDLGHSAKELAMRLYQEVGAELRTFVAKMVGQRVDRPSPSR